MRLKSISYAEFRGGPQEWVLHSLTLDKANLIVGKNATGKSRALNVISGLSSYLMGERRAAVSGEYKCEFEDAAGAVLYFFETRDKQIVNERLMVDGRTLLDRGEGGAGKILAEKLDGEAAHLAFQAPPEGLAATLRRDSIQHPFLERLHQWAAGVRHYHFGSVLAAC